MENAISALSGFTAEELEQALMALNDSSDATNEIENMYLNFTIGEQIYGIEVRNVLQIIGMQPISTMPDMEPDMKGYINLRGNIIPVISLRLHFGQMEEEYTDRTCIVVVKINEREIGLVVDSIQETITITPEDISPPPGTGDHADNSYVRGIARLSSGRTAVLLQAQKLFAGSNY